MAQRFILTSMAGIEVGHYKRSDQPTGCTVVLSRSGATGGVAVQGYAPGTRETNLTDPSATVQQVHAVVLSGGSSFGLATADGVVRRLHEEGVGFPITGGPVAIVPAAILTTWGSAAPATPPPRMEPRH